jgi:hypothetical protein
VREFFSIVGLKELKRSEEITFSREKVRPKIVGLAEGMKAEAFEHLQKSSKSKKLKSQEEERQQPLDQLLGESWTVRSTSREAEEKR